MPRHNKPMPRNTPPESNDSIVRRELLSYIYEPIISAYRGRPEEDQIVLSEEMGMVDGFLRAVLSRSFHYADLKAILPECTHDKLMSLYSNHNPQFFKLSPEQHQELIKKNQKYIDLIKQQVLRNLLL